MLHFQDTARMLVLMAVSAVVAVAVQSPDGEHGAGMLTWTGKLGNNETLTISNGMPSTGTVSGAQLPGVPVRLVINQSNLGISEMPNVSNGYRGLVLKSHSRHDKIVIHWTVIRQ